MDSFDFDRRLTVAVALLTTCIAAPGGAAMAAGGLCSEPHVPACLSAPGGFDSEAEKGRCRYALDSYLAAIERRANCLLQLAEEQARRHVEQGRREAHEARGEGREARERFECKARGNSC